MAEPVLSICVPSRNRQIYFQQTIASLAGSGRGNVEFVLADNSDDPEIMNAFMQSYMGDARVVYLASPPNTLSMMDNWERALNAATGRFVAFIGDDDYLDPDLADFLVNLEGKIDADAVAWTGPNYVWPTGTSHARTISISLNTQVTQFDKAVLMRKAFQWENCAHVPLSGFSIYHGALSRKLLDRIRAMGSGRYFEFPIIDYEMAFKAILLGKTFVHSSRPFSVLGACPLSNSVTIGNVEAEKKGQEIFFRELGRDMNDDPWMRDTPFRTWHGVTACIYLIQFWLSQKHGLKMAGYEANLVKAFAANCALYQDRDGFHLIAGRYRQALAQWQGGRYLAAFNPEFRAPPVSQVAAPVFSGLGPNNQIYFPDDIGGADTPGRLFQVFAGMLQRPADIEIKLGQSREQLFETNILAGAAA